MTKSLIEILKVAQDTNEVIKTEFTSRAELGAFLGMLHMLVSLEAIPSPEELAAARVTTDKVN